jgi:queuine tRNA-ribosyltransferase
MATLQFDLQKKDEQTKARAARIITDHGEVQTPAFMPVGTAGSVKAVTQQQLIHDIKAQMILANTYHLFLRPGVDTLQQAGGLHKFIGWNRPILTDSGGYQVFSLSGTRKITEEGVTFQSHIDGAKHLFTPEKVIDIQRAIGADIVMAFDECTPYPVEFDEAGKSMQLTHRWLRRCVDQFNSTGTLYGYTQNFFPIVQGSVYKELRKESAEFISALGLPGNAIGGLSVGEPEEIMYEICGICCDILPALRPRYLMGVGTPWNMLECISLGIDLFDCVLPTRNGRNSMLFTSNGVINIDNKKWENDFSPIDEGIGSVVSNHYSKAYLRHLMKSKELLGLTIASVHNLAFYVHLMTEAREHILQDNFLQWKTSQVEILRQRL